MTEAKKRTIPIRNHEPGAGAETATGTAASAEGEDRPAEAATEAQATATEAEAVATEAETVATEAEATAGVPAGGGPAAPSAPAQHVGESGGETTADLVARLTAERDGYLDSLLRLKAEFENYRKRSQRELLEAGGRARARLLEEFLPILDNLDRALNAAEHHEEGKVLEGVRLTHALFLDLLRKEEVSPIEALGRPFDPQLHDAVLSRPSEYEEGIVSDVLEPGYMFGERVLRPAKVVVSSGSAEDGASA
ncbi:MAG: nucleotide exchange factor GrpE [Actinobacteria bacterium]|nr:nucleotide exchange factor GrpE [Actinomycetota bacterium]